MENERSRRVNIYEVLVVQEEASCVTWGKNNVLEDNEAISSLKKYLALSCFLKCM